MSSSLASPHRGEGRTMRDAVVVHWVNQYAVTTDQPGGTRHLEMAAALRRSGYDVRIVASDLNLTDRRYARRRGPTDRRVLTEDVDGVPFTWLPAGSYERNDWRRAFSMASFAWHVLRYLLVTVRRGDVVIGSSPQLLAAGTARLATALRRGRFVLEVRDLWPESLTEVTGRWHPLVLVLRVVADLLYRTSSAIVILAEGNRGPIVARGGRADRIVFVPNGVDVDALDGPPQELPEDLRWVPERPTFVYAGAHGPANGLDLLLDAAELLSEPTDSGITVLLVGDGPAKRELVRDAERRRLRNVVFHDPIPKAAVPALLRSSAGGLMVLKDVALFRRGVSPNKLFDYLAAGLPVITNVPGDVADTVERAEGGVSVPPNDAEALAGAMRALRTDGVRYRGSGEAYVRRHHDRRLLAARIEQVLQTVTKDALRARATC